jgi:hypothetical protein
MNPNGQENANPNQTEHALGPLVWREPFGRPMLGRSAAALMSLGCAAVLGVALWVQPSPQGYGTHRKLGLAPCGFLVKTGYPCLTCGMTTAFSLSVRGRLAAAIHAQPLGMVLTGVTALAAVLLGIIAVTGKTWAVNWYRIPPLRVVWAIGLTFIISWGVKIAWGLLDGSLPLRRG